MSTDRIRDDPAVQDLDAPARRHVISLVDVAQRELWEFQDGTNDDPDPAEWPGQNGADEPKPGEPLADGGAACPRHESTLFERVTGRTTVTARQQPDGDRVAETHEIDLRDGLEGALDSQDVSDQGVSL